MRVNNIKKNKLTVQQGQKKTICFKTLELFSRKHHLFS